MQILNENKNQPFAFSYIKIECKILVFVSLIEYNQEQKSLNVELIEWELVVFLLKQLIHFNDKYQPMSR